MIHTFLKGRAETGERNKGYWNRLEKENGFRYPLSFLYFHFPVLPFPLSLFRSPVSFAPFIDLTIYKVLSYRVIE
jgi:hypothetical protein